MASRTPHLGQGGCQALEDAVVLAAALAGTPDVPAALEHYDGQRRPRINVVVRAAFQVRRMNTLSNPLAVAARNSLVNLTPSAIGIRSMARISHWEPPHISPLPM